MRFNQMEVTMLGLSRNEGVIVWGHFALISKELGFPIYKVNPESKDLCTHAINCSDDDFISLLQLAKEKLDDFKFSKLGSGK